MPRWPKVAIAAFFALAALAPAWPEKPAPSALDTGRKGQTRMSTLKIVITPKSASVLSSESLPVAVVLSNDGPAAVEIPDPDSPSTFQFELAGADPGLPTLLLSASSARLARDPNPVPGLGEAPKLLAPGQSERYEDDLASYLVSPLAPGRYGLTVLTSGSDGTLRSATVPLQVLAPAVTAMALAVGVDAQLQSVLAHRRDDGGAVVLQGSSRPARPQDGMAFRRIELTPGPALSSVAAALDIGTDVGRTQARWYAYLHAGRVGAGVADGATQFVQVAPAEVGLQAMQLHPVGWQPDVNHAWFVALGSDAGGKPTLAVLNFSARERRASVRTVPLAGPMPERWAVQLQPAGGGALLVVSADINGDTTRLQAQRIALDSGAADAPAVLLQRQQPLAALALPPLAADVTAGAVDLLFGPGRGEAKMSFVRQPLSGAAAIAEFVFDAPRDSEQRLPTQWALAAAGQGMPAAVAAFRGQVIGRTLAPTGRGFVIEARARQVSHLQAVVVEGAFWAVWADPALGLQYRAFP